MRDCEEPTVNLSHCPSDTREFLGKLDANIDTSCDASVETLLTFRCIQDIHDINEQANDLERTVAQELVDNIGGWPELLDQLNAISALVNCICEPPKSRVWAGHGISEARNTRWEGRTNLGEQMLNDDLETLRLIGRIFGQLRN